MMTKADEITIEGEPYMIFSVTANAIIGENLSATDAARILDAGAGSDQLIALPLIEWATLASAT